jgi:hypothetical protein
MPKKLSTTLCMKEGLTYLMVTIFYHLPYSRLLECDELWLIYVGRKMRGVDGLPSVDMLIIIIVETYIFF